VGPIRRHIVKHGWPGYTRHEPLHRFQNGNHRVHEGLANDVANDGITANAVLPGLTNTVAIAPQSEEQRRSTWEQQAIKRLGEPEDVTGAVLFLTSDDAAFITGQAIVVDGGQYRIGQVFTAHSRLNHGSDVMILENAGLRSALL
jgi:hypothetical protein